MNYKAIKYAANITWATAAAYFIGYSVLDEKAGKDPDILNHLNKASRVEQIVQNTEHKLVDEYTLKSGWKIKEKAILFDEKDSSRYEFMLNYDHKNQNVSIRARIETVPDKEKEFRYMVIKKKNREFLKDEWKDAEIILGKGHKKIITADIAEEQGIADLIKAAATKLQYLKKEREKHVKAHLAHLGSKGAMMIAEDIVSNEAYNIPIEYDSKTYTIRTRGYKITPETEIEILYLKKEEETHKFSELDKTVKKIIRNKYEDLGETLIDEAKEHRDHMNKSLKMETDARKLKEMKEKKRKEQENKRLKKHLEGL